MNTTDYIVNGILVLLVIRQIRGGRLDLTGLLLPVVLVGATAAYYLRSVPTAGNDLDLELALAGAGAVLGIACGATTLLTRRQDGVHARAGVLAAVLWVLGMATRMGFSFASDHGAGGSIAHFSRTHQITSSQAWVAAFVLMALSEAVARLLAIRLRAWRLSSSGAVAEATA
ncbi:hypothetical protein GXW83_21730 [Streptacidiphilus sp. PB12-B1b]|uniref:hypothetical protein n=1 Tax=Streptacidiphilus sp. PB12-B1b TaxID=2705012 RepID=UPI0015F7D1C4|nr:hypothetical protein [Streptacidiphilus sp. PB12-B1b]QMU77923.1 hypothetical protein GXW83_21730 [Streptacidiphilus sp. PB12-B1b]